MNSTFNFQRFKNYFAYEFKSTFSTNSLFTLVFLGGMLSMVILTVLNGDSWVMREYHYDPMQSVMATFFYGGLFLFTVIGASLAFSGLKRKSLRIQSLMLPASTFEKFLAQWIIYIPLTFILFIIGFELVDLIRMILQKLTWEYSADANFFFAQDHNGLRDFISEGGLLMLLTLQSLYFLGAAVWPSLSALKTSLALFCITMGLFICGCALGSASSPIFIDNIRALFDVPTTTFTCIYQTFLLAISVVSWVLTYFRLKEAEVIQRW